MDTNLSDDMVKLVRYTIASIERDHERIIYHGEKIVTDNMTDDAFASWVIASYLQSDEHARGGHIEHHEKKYLRVCSEVLCRWAKQDRKYEERQLRVLDQIRAAIEHDGGGGPPPPSGGKPEPWDALEKRLKANAVRLKYLRQGFQLCADRLAEGVAGAYTRFRDLGEFKAIEVDEQRLAEAFRRGLKSDFDPAGLESFPAKWRGTNRHYDAQGKEIPADAATWHMTWEKGTFHEGEYVQRVVGSKERNLTSDALPDLKERKVDLALNVYRKDIGITGWLTMWVESRNELALISYELSPGTFLWIGQVLKENLEPEMGEKLFWMFLEWIDADRKHYYMYGLLFNIDFEECTAMAIEDQGFRKSRFDRVG